MNAGIRPSRVAVSRSVPPAGLRQLASARRGAFEKVRTSESTLPFSLVLTFLFFEFGRPQDWFPPLGVLHPGILLAPPLALFFLCNAQGQLPKLAKLMLAFLFLLTALIPFAFNQRVAFNGSFDLAILLLGAVLPLTVAVNSFEKLCKLFRAFVWLHVPLALYSLAHRGQGVGSFLGDENDFALALNVALPYAIALSIVSPTKLKRLGYGLAAGLFLTAVIVTFSRGGFVGLVAVSLILWLRSPRKLVSATAVALVIVVLSLVMPAIEQLGTRRATGLRGTTYWEQMQSIFTSTNENDTGYGRLYFWGIAWKMFLDHPVVGVGANNEPMRSPEYESEYEKSRGHFVWGHAVHSIYFTLLPETGIAGTTLFVVMVVSGWNGRRRLVQAYRELAKRPGAPTSPPDRLRRLYYLTLAMDASLVGYLASGAFLSALYYPHFWLLTGFTIVMMRQFGAELKGATAAEPEMSAAQLKAFGNQTFRRWTRPA